MHNFEKAKILKDRHVKITIEWGGTDLFTHCSDMSLEGVVEFLDILKLDNAYEVNRRLTDLIKKENDKEN